MTQEEIIEMAREAGGQVTAWVNHSTIQKTTTFTFESPLDYSVSGEHPEKYHIKFLEAFANLVAKHTLMNIDPSKFMSHQEVMEAARMAEREACAKVCQDLIAPDIYSDTDVSMWDVTCMDCAAAIRARGQA